MRQTALSVASWLLKVLLVTIPTVSVNKATGGEWGVGVGGEVNAEGDGVGGNSDKRTLVTALTRTKYANQP